MVRQLNNPIDSERHNNKMQRAWCAGIQRTDRQTDRQTQIRIIFMRIHLYSYMPIYLATNLPTCLFIYLSTSLPTYVAVLLHDEESTAGDGYETRKCCQSKLASVFAGLADAPKLSWHGELYVFVEFHCVIAEKPCQAQEQTLRRILANSTSRSLSSLGSIVSFCC